MKRENTVVTFKMSVVNSWMLVLWILQMTLSGLSLGQSILDTPKNTAALQGEDVRLNCSAILTGGAQTEVLEWKHYFTPETETRIWISSNSGQPANRRFQIERYGDNYDLIVKDVTLDMAGMYTCTLIYSDNEAIAEIVVLGYQVCLPEMDEPPMSPSPPYVLEDTVLLFSCSVSYSGYKAPKLEWWNSRGMAQTKYTVDEDNMIVTAVASETATPDMDEEMFECRLFFEGDEGDGPPPRYTDHCKSWYRVIYAPQDIVISPNPDSVEGGILQLYTGDHVNCSSDGRPQPSYLWYEKATGTTPEDPGPILVITEEMADREDFPVVWVCRASNMVNGNPRETEMEVKMMIDCQSRILKNGAVSSNNYPDMYDRQEDHTQNITVTDGDYLVLWLDDLDLPPPSLLTQPTAAPPTSNTIMTSCTDYVLIYELDLEGAPVDIARLCGNIDTFVPRSRYFVSLQGKRKEVFVTLHVARNIPDSFVGRGYRLLYSAGYLNVETNPDTSKYVLFHREATGLLPSLQFPDVKTSTNYAMLFQNDNYNQGVELVIAYFDNSRGSCDTGPNRSSMVFVNYKNIDNSFIICGGSETDSVPPIHVHITAASYMYIDLYNANLLITYRKIQYNTNQNGESSNNVATLDFNSVAEGSTCTWRIESANNTVVGVYVYGIVGYKKSTDYCMYNSVHVIDGSGSMLFYMCPGTNTWGSSFGVSASSNVIYVKANNISADVPVTFSLESRLFSNQQSLEPIVNLTCYLPEKPTTLIPDPDVNRVTTSILIENRSAVTSISAGLFVCLSISIYHSYLAHLVFDVEMF